MEGAVNLKETYFPTHASFLNNGLFGEVEFAVIPYLLHKHSTLEDYHLQEAIEKCRGKAQTLFADGPIPTDQGTWDVLKCMIE